MSKNVKSNNIWFNLFLALNSTSLILVIYFIKSYTDKNVLNKFFSKLPSNVNFIIYSFILLLIPFLLTGVSILLAKCLKDYKDNNYKKTIYKQIEQANNSFLPSYLGYFFVALSINELKVAVIIFLILLIFTVHSQALYFNPLFLLWGYKFYYLTKNDDIKIFVISKRILILPKDIQFGNLHRINDYTFINIGEK